jgi:hypothetical protein
MRKLTMAALAGLMVAGGAIAGCASDPYYDGYASTGYRTYAATRYDPYFDRYYYGPVARPGYTYDATIGASVLGSLLGTGYYGDVPVDRYGPNPEGMRAPDGHRIDCSLRRSYDRALGAYITRRVCF